MPKIKSYTPRWLTDPTTSGHQLFTRSQGDATSLRFSSKKTEPGPRRTIARRGTEVFVANGKEIKWGDLVYLKDGWETKQARSFRPSQIKREESNGSLDSPDGITNGDGHSSEGYRVGICPAKPWNLCANQCPRRSRRPLPTTFGNSSCRPCQTIWPYSRLTRCTYACSPTPRT